MEEQRLEAYTYMNFKGIMSTIINIPVTFLSVPIYQVRTVDLMLFIVDTGASTRAKEIKKLKRIFYSVVCLSIPTIESKRDFLFGEA